MYREYKPLLAPSDKKQEKPVVGGGEKSFGDWLFGETVKIHGEKAGETVGETKESVKKLRKFINTRISKIKRGEGNKETHKGAVKKHLKTLARFSKEDYKEMTAKFESAL